MRFTDEDFKAAVGVRIITERSAAERRRSVATQRTGTDAAAENFRPLTGFNDIFVAIAIVLTLAAAFLLLSVAQPMLAGPFVAVAAWVLAEHFTRQRRMALPSIVLVLTFSGTVGWDVDDAVGTQLLNGADSVWLALAAGLAASAAAALAHWYRFKVPITICALALAGFSTVYVVVSAVFPSLKPYESAMLLGIGCLLFGLGLWWDFGDAARVTRRADVAFWLHLVAAPIIVQPMFQILDLFGPDTTGTARPLLAVPIYFALGVVALAIDRRAMLVSGLMYMLPAVGMLIGAGGGNGGGFALTGLLIGGGILMMSIWWRSLRALVLQGVPRRARRWLPPVPERSAPIP